MTLQQLHQVITIAESKSMNEAARKLFVSQPNLSSVVRELEEEAGITIFIRSNRGIVMTPEGEEFIGYAKQVVEQYHLLEKRYMNSETKKKFSVSMQHYSFSGNMIWNLKNFLHVILMYICGKDIRLRRSHRSVWLNWRSTRVLYLNRERIIRSILRKK